MIRVGLAATCLALILMAGVMAWTYGHLPMIGPIPIHYAGDGHADGWAPDRDHAVRYLFVLMGAAWFFGLMFAAVAYLAPKGGGLSQSRPALVVIWIGSAALITVIAGVIALKMVHNAGGGIPAEAATDTWRWVGAGVSVLYIAIGNVLPKTRPNFFLGIRTPWTLSSPSTWEKSHRLGGLLLMLAGLAGVVGAFVFSGRWALYSGVAAMLTAAFITVVYSFLVWLKATDKGQTPNYLP